MRLQNSGHNCIAGQVVILSADWPQRDAFLAELRTCVRRLPRASGLVPAQRRETRGRGIRLSGRDLVRRRHARCSSRPGRAPTRRRSRPRSTSRPCSGSSTLPGNGQEFLDAAVAHANERLAGTLGANVLIDPATQAALGDGFEHAIADLRYGSISINSWTAFAFLTPDAHLGRLPRRDARRTSRAASASCTTRCCSTGVERSVTRGPFRPFPRSIPRIIRSMSLSKGSVLPKPPWFVDSRTGATVSEGLHPLPMDGNCARMAGTLVQAFRA